MAHEIECKVAFYGFRTNVAARLNRVLVFKIETES